MSKINIFAPKSNDFIKKSEVFIIFEYSANEVVMFVAQCGLNEFQSKKFYADKIAAQDDKLNKILAEKDALEEKCKALEKKLSDLQWAHDMSQAVNGKLNDTITELKEQKNKAQA